MSAPAATGPTPAQWVAGARPRTLPAAVAPVVVGTGAAVAAGGGDAVLAGLCLVLALALQVAVNYANDYSDGVRGTDSAARVGPVRLVGSGTATPRQVLGAALAAFAVAVAAGLAVVVVSRVWPLLLVGAVSLAAAWGYTGGRRPYGYRGLGEVAVFVFFGLVAVLGTAAAQGGGVTAAGMAGAVGVGCLACAILVANNLRDVATDGPAGKRTLAVVLGEGGTRRLYLVLLLVALGAVAAAALATASPWPLLAALSVPLAVGPVRAVVSGAAGRALLPVLGATGRLELVYGLLLGVGLALARTGAG